MDKSYSTQFAFTSPSYEIEHSILSWYLRFLLSYTNLKPSTPLRTGKPALCVGLPVLIGVDGLVYDSIGLGGLALGAGIVGNVVEELVKVGLTQPKEFVTIVDASYLGGKNKAGSAAQLTT